MELSKVQVVVEWPTPWTDKELQQFQGFPNFYRWFIRGFSTRAHPLMSLLRGTPRWLAWTPAAQEVFNKLKKAF
ncbi:MAG: hypothetical protein ACRC8G_04530, partial [Plesiomonas shigelloides]